MPTKRIAMSEIQDQTQRITALSYAFYERAGLAKILTSFESSAAIFRETAECSTELSLQRLDQKLRAIYTNNIKRVLSSPKPATNGKPDTFYLFKDILEVANDLKAGLRISEEQGHCMTINCLTGFYSDVLQGLKANNFHALQLAVGDKFDPEFHNALGEKPAVPDIPAGSIHEIIKDGFTYDQKLIQPADVLVASRG